MTVGSVTTATPPEAGNAALIEWCPDEWVLPWRTQDYQAHFAASGAMGGVGWLPTDTLRQPLGVLAAVIDAQRQQAKKS